MSGANASPTGRSHQLMSGANASPIEGSHIYKPSMTIAEVARYYTANDAGVWARHVADHLGVSVETSLCEVAG